MAKNEEKVRKTKLNDTGGLWILGCEMGRLYQVN